MSGWDAAALMGAVVSAVLYSIGSRRLAQRNARVRMLERTSFWSGWAALVAAIAPPLDRAAAATFSAHMVQHELLMVVAAPLIVLGRPIVPWLWALPAPLRATANRTLKLQPVSRVWLLATTPVVAWALHGVAIWIWHLPLLYERAMENEALHAFEHATFVGTAVLFWWGLVYGRYGRAAYGASVLYVFTTMVHTGMLGAIFALSTAPFYDVYQSRAAAAGVDAVADQQLAGLYMWIPAGVVLTACGLALLVAWLSEPERRMRVHGPVSLVFASLLISSSLACSGVAHERDARLLTGGDPRRGRQQITNYGCDTCHTIPGITTADADVGPPLTRIARRVYLAGHLENTPENMRRWIEHPHAFDEKTVMPEMGVTERDSRDITAYLYTLR
jgi:putative membrane protein